MYFLGTFTLFPINLPPHKILLALMAPLASPPRVEETEGCTWLPHFTINEKKIYPTFTQEEGGGRKKRHLPSVCSGD